MARVKKILIVRDFMSIDPPTVAPNDCLQKVVELLRRRDIRSVAVLEDGKLVGIVTDCDVRQVAPGYPLLHDEDEIRRYRENLRVTAALTADPMTIAPNTPLVEAAKILETYRIGSLPVVDGTKLVGMLTADDLLRAFVKQNQQAA